jgi:hypothetical protein
MISPPASQNQQNGLPRFNSIKNATSGTIPGIKTITTRRAAKSKLRIVIIEFTFLRNAHAFVRVIPWSPLLVVYCK